MNRRYFIKSAAASGFIGVNGTYEWGRIKSTRFDRLPGNLKALYQRVLAREPQFYNTDWDGSMAMEALLRWNRHGAPTALDFVQMWFDYHITNDHLLSPDKFYSSYIGPKSRLIRGTLPFTLYSGFFSLSFPCYELYKQTGDSRARLVCLDVADAILHQTGRNHLGLVLHDDRQHAFTIPDTIYFVVRALMIAASLDGRIGDVYEKQALYQIRTCTEVFLDRENGLVHTILTRNGLGTTYWCRAAGWLTYAFAAVLRCLPPGHPEFQKLLSDFRILAKGLVRHQGTSGGLYVLIDQPSTPEETSSTAMCVAAIKEGMRKGWLTNTFDDFTQRGWEFVLKNVQKDGTVRSIYTGWAVTAENGEIIMDQSNRERSWIYGVILYAAEEMLK